MADETYVRYSKALKFRRIDAEKDAALLIRFGRDLYRQSLGREDAFYRDYGRYGVNFPSWIGSCAALNAGFASFLIEDGDEIGLVVLGIDQHDPTVGRVHHFYVTADHRGQGFGGILDDYARDALKDAGASIARLNVTARNRRAIRFYEAQGWKEKARRGGLIFMETRL